MINANLVRFDPVPIWSGRSGGSVVDNKLDYQSRDHKIHLRLLLFQTKVLSLYDLSGGTLNP